MERSMMDLTKLKELALAATPGKWSWWTSNSYLRLSSERGGDGDILHGAVLSDGCCTVTVSEANRDFIEAATPAAVSELIALVGSQDGEIAALRDAARAAIAYDKAIQRCANDPGSMSSFCTAQGDDLDSLYAAWIKKSRAALTKFGAPQHQRAAPDERKPALSMFATMDDYREALTDWQARAEFERQHSGRDLSRHHLRGTYSSGPIAALWNQHIRTIKWLEGRDALQDKADPEYGAAANIPTEAFEYARKAVP